MNLKLILSVSVAFAFLLTLPGVSCEKDLNKKEFGDELGAYIKTNVIEYFEIVIQTIKDFYDRLLNEASPSPAQIAEIKQNKIDLDELKRKIPKLINDPPKFMETAKDFVKSKYLRMIKSANDSLSQFDESKNQIVMEVFQDSETTLHDASSKFGLGVYYKWTELYEELPKAALDREPEFEEINEMMQGVKRTKGRGAVFLDAIKEFIKFFNVTEWLFLLDTGKSDSMENV